MDGSKPSDADAPLRIPLNRRQREVLLEQIVLPVRFMRPIRVGQVEGAFFYVRLTMDQLDELLDFIEDKASETKNQKLQEEMYRPVRVLGTVRPEKDRRHGGVPPSFQ